MRADILNIITKFKYGACDSTVIKQELFLHLLKPVDLSELSNSFP
jgi:hypothetical protein